MNRILNLLSENRPLVMGILNTTPDSFSDGGQFDSLSTAVDHVRQMIDEGADIIDIGGESTRPGAQPVSVEAELARVIPVISAIRQFSDIAISIDTSKPEVMQQAVEAGADMVNDVNALQAEGALAVCVQMDIPVCVMHMQGEPRTMQNNPHYDDVVQDIKNFLQRRIDDCAAAGIRREHIILDPGFGFGKTLEQNYSLLKHLDDFLSLGCPLLTGISRKSMIGMVLDADVEQRLAGSLSAVVLAWSKGSRIFRVHDVKATVDALKICTTMSAAE